MIFEVYKHKKLYIISLLDNDEKFITSSGHSSLGEMQIFIDRCRQLFPDEAFVSRWLGELKKKVSYSNRISKNLYRTLLI